jgi:hypothetical protein
MNIKNINYETLFYDLLKIVKTDDVEKYLSANGLLNRDLWKNINGVVNTDGIINNNNADCVPALTEKLTNSVDAIIEREVELSTNPIYPDKYEKVINDYCSHIKVENTFNKHLHTFKNLPNMYIVSRDGTIIPTLDIIDRGVGQDITTFEKTFLTMTNSNKITKFCLNGAYNTGSFSIVRHLKKPNYQLIISKKPASLIEKNCNKYIWSFTILRIFEPKKGDKLNEFKFLCPNSIIPHFESKAGIKVIPIRGDKKIRDHLEYGTLIQLYECDTKGFNSLITSDLRYRLDWYYPNIPFPVSMIEEREKYHNSNAERSKLNGAKFEFDQSIKLNGEEVLYDVSNVAKVGKYKIPYHIYIENIITTRGGGKERNKKNQDRKKRGDISYFFTVNGQTQATKTNNRIKKIYSYILKNIVVFVDYSSIEPHELGGHIKTDRSGLNSNSNINEKIFEIIDDELRNNPNIVAIEEDIRKSKLNSSDDYDQNKAKEKALDFVCKYLKLKETPIATDYNGITSEHYSGKQKGILPKNHNGKDHDNTVKTTPVITNYSTIDDFILKYSNYNFNSPKTGYKDDTNKIKLYSDVSVDVKIKVDNKFIQNVINSDFPGNATIYIKHSSENGFRVNKNSEVNIKFFIDAGVNVIEKEVTYNVMVFEKREESNKPQMARNNFGKINDKINVVFQTYDVLSSGVLTNSFKFSNDVVALPLISGENSIDIYFNLSNPKFVRVLDAGVLIGENEQEKIKGTIDLALRIETLKLYDIYHRLNVNDENESKIEYTNDIISLESIMKDTTLEKQLFNHFYILQDSLIKLYKDEY